MEVCEEVRVEVAAAWSGMAVWEVVVARAAANERAGLVAKASRVVVMARARVAAGEGMTAAAMEAASAAMEAASAAAIVVVHTELADGRLPGY